MGYVKKTWKNRSSEHPNRRRLTYITDGKSESVDVALDEGTVATEGDLFSAETMNDLETRIESAIDEVFTSGSNVKASVVAAVTAKGQAATVADTWTVLVNKIKAIESKLSGTAYAAKVLSGATFYSNDPDKKMTGTMTNWTGTPNKIRNRRIANGRFEVAVDQGYHGCYWAGDSYEYMEFSEVAGLIGLTSSKLVKGNTILGIVGDAEPVENVSAISLSIIATAANGASASASAPYTGWYMLFKCDQDASFDAAEFKYANAGTVLTKDSNRINSSYAARAYIFRMNISYS